MKKALSILLSLIMVIGMIPMAVFSAVAEDIQYTEIDSIKDITGAGYYKLADDYAGEAKDTEITAPVELSGTTVIDGNGKTVTNLTVSCAGIFKVTDTGSLTISNLTFGAEDEKIAFTRTSGDSGFLVSNVSGTGTVIMTNVTVNVDAKNGGTIAAMIGVLNGYATFINCTVNGSIENTSTTHAGGFIAYAQCKNLTMTDCVNNATIKGGQNGGGFVGFLNTNGSDVGVPTLTNCVNYGDVSAKSNNSGYDGVGGIIGCARWGYEFRLNNCTNNGVVSSTATGTSSGHSGGIIGWTRGSAKIDHCMNNATVSHAAYRAGGIVGHVDKLDDNNVAVISNCVNNGNVNGATSGNGAWLGGLVASATCKVLQFIGCSNYGKVEGVYTGGMIGALDSGSVSFSDCANYGEIVSRGQYSGGFVCKNGVAFTADSCVNYGKITGRQTGGIIGNSQAAPTITNSANFGVISASAYGSPIVAACKGLTVRNFVVGNASVSGSTATGIVAGIIEANAIDAKYILNLAGIQENVGVIKSGASAEVSDVNTLSTSNVADILAIANSETGYTDGDVTYKFTDIVGKFKLNSAGTNIVPATPVLQGYQVGMTETRTIGGNEVEVYSIRILATINDTLDYDFVGFNILINGQPYTKQSANGDYTVPCVYTSIQAADDGAQVTTTAEELGGKYIYACILDEIPVDGSAVLTINAFAEKGTERYEAGAYTVTIQNGKIVPNAQ